jgi:hypothetical protein
MPILPVNHLGADMNVFWSATLAALLLAQTACTPKNDAANGSTKSPTTDGKTEAGGTAPDTTSTVTTSSSAATTEDTSTDTDGTQLPGTLALDTLTETQLVQTMSNALVSAAQAQDAAGASLNPGTVALSTGLTATETCSASGSPIVVEGAVNEGQFAALSAYCDLTKHPDGPDTTLGGIDRVQGILCALAPITYDGQPHDVMMKITEDCFDKTFVDMVHEQFCGETPEMCPGGVVTMPHTVTATKIDASTDNGYDRTLTIEVPAGKEGFAYHIKLVQTDERLAAAVYDPASDAEKGVVFAMSLDLGSPATIRYEGRFTRREGELDGWRRHLRVLANGSFDVTTRSFTAIDNLRYVFWDTYLNGGFKFMSVKGSPTAGFRAIGLDGGDAFALASYQFDPTATPPSKSICYGSGDCTDNAGITVSAEADLAFAKSLVPEDAAFLPFATWHGSHGPLAFDDVTLAAEQD